MFQKRVEIIEDINVKKPMKYSLTTVLDSPFLSVVL